MECRLRGDTKETGIGGMMKGSRFKLKINDIKKEMFAKLLCDKLPVKLNAFSYNTTGEYISSDEANISQINIRKTQDMTLEEFKEVLSQNPITVQYQLETESIETVDLSILDQNGQSVDHLKSFNGGTHVCTSSLEGSLVPSVDISVVTDLEETLKVCSLDGNTL